MPVQVCGILSRKWQFSITCLCLTAKHISLSHSGHAARVIKTFKLKCSS